MQLIFKIAILLGGCLAGMLPNASCSLAGHLAMEVAPEAVLRGDGLLEVSTAVTNRGDEAATNLRISVLNPPEAASSQTWEVLPEGQSAELAATAARAQAGPGRYAAIVRLDFQDLNQTPLSALGFAYYHLERDWASPLAVQAPPLKLQGSGQLSVRLTNTEDKAIKVAARIFTPRELWVEQAFLEAHIPPRQSQDLAWDIVNVTGQDEAEYPVLLLTAYDHEGLHTEKVTEVKVTLAAEENVFRMNLAWWLAGLLMLAAWVVHRQLRSHRKK